MIQLRFDNYYNDYSELHKINKLTLLLIARYFNISTMIQEQDLMNSQKYYMSVYNRDIKAEFADLSILSPDAGIECRLSLTCFKSGWDMLTVADYWLDVLKKATNRDNYTKLTNEINDRLIVTYSKERQSGEIKNIMHFVIKYMDNIFTNMQLIDLLTRLGVDDPEVVASLYRMRSKSRFFSARQLRQYVTDLTISANDLLDIYRDTKTVTGSSEMKFYVSIKDNQQD